MTQKPANKTKRINPPSHPRSVNPVAKMPVEGISPVPPEAGFPIVGIGASAGGLLSRDIARGDLFYIIRILLCEPGETVNEETPT